MLFFPYTVDLDLKRIPFFTILICLGCIAIYVYQFKTDWQITESAVEYCEQAKQRSFDLVIRQVSGSTDVSGCVNTLRAIHSSDDPKKTITAMAKGSREYNGLSAGDKVELVTEVLTRNYSKFRQSTIPSLTKRLMYEPSSFSFHHMITAVFAHGSWTHLLGNLFFFFAFAASVEIVLGSFSFLMLIVSLAVGTNISYSLAMLNESNALPTLGLSGVVMGMIGLFTFLMPMARIRCFFWFFVIVKKLSLPAWILAFWYIGWDVFHLYTDPDQSNINLIAHVSGAAIGFVAGVLFFRNQRPVLSPVNIR